MGALQGKHRCYPVTSPEDVFVPDAERNVQLREWLSNTHNSLLSGYVECCEMVVDSMSSELRQFSVQSANSIGTELSAAIGVLPDETPLMHCSVFPEYSLSETFHFNNAFQSFWETIDQGPHHRSEFVAKSPQFAQNVDEIVKESIETIMNTKKKDQENPPSDDEDREDADQDAKDSGASQYKLKETEVGVFYYINRLLIFLWDKGLKHRGMYKYERKAIHAFLEELMVKDMSLPMCTTASYKGIDITVFAPVPIRREDCVLRLNNIVRLEDKTALKDSKSLLEAALAQEGPIEKEDRICTSPEAFAVCEEVAIHLKYPHPRFPHSVYRGLDGRLYFIGVSYMLHFFSDMKTKITGGQQNAEALAQDEKRRTPTPTTPATPQTPGVVSGAEEQPLHPYKVCEGLPVAIPVSLLLTARGPQDHLYKDMADARSEKFSEEDIGYSTHVDTSEWRENAQEYFCRTVIPKTAKLLLDKRPPSAKKKDPNEEPPPPPPLEDLKKFLHREGIPLRFSSLLLSHMYKTARDPTQVIEWLQASIGTGIAAPMIKDKLATAWGEDAQNEKVAFMQAMEIVNGVLLFANKKEATGFFSSRSEKNAAEANNRRYKWSREVLFPAILNRCPFRDGMLDFATVEVQDGAKTWAQEKLAHRVGLSFPSSSSQVKTSAPVVIEGTPKQAISTRFITLPPPRLSRADLLQMVLMHIQRKDDRLRLSMSSALLWLRLLEVAMVRAPRVSPSETVSIELPNSKRRLTTTLKEIIENALFLERHEKGSQTLKVRLQSRLAAQMIRMSDEIPVEEDGVSEDQQVLSPPTAASLRRRKSSRHASASSFTGGDLEMQETVVFDQGHDLGYSEVGDPMVHKAHTEHLVALGPDPKFRQGDEPAFLRYAFGNVLQSLEEKYTVGHTLELHVTPRESASILLARFGREEKETMEKLDELAAPLLAQFEYSPRKMQFHSYIQKYCWFNFLFVLAGYFRGKELAGGASPSAASSVGAITSKLEHWLYFSVNAARASHGVLSFDGVNICRMIAIKYMDMLLECWPHAASKLGVKISCSKDDQELSHEAGRRISRVASIRPRRNAQSNTLSKAMSSRWGSTMMSRGSFTRGGTMASLNETRTGGGGLHVLKDPSHPVNAFRLIFCEVAEDLAVSLKEIFERRRQEEAEKPREEILLDYEWGFAAVNVGTALAATLSRLSTAYHNASHSYMLLGDKDSREDAFLRCYNSVNEAATFAAETVEMAEGYNAHALTEQSMVYLDCLENVVTVAVQAYHAFASGAEDRLKEMLAIIRKVFECNKITIAKHKPVPDLMLSLNPGTFQELHALRETAESSANRNHEVIIEYKPRIVTHLDFVERNLQKLGNLLLMKSVVAVQRFYRKMKNAVQDKIRRKHLLQDIASKMIKLYDSEEAARRKFWFQFVGERHRQTIICLAGYEDSLRRVIEREWDESFAASPAHLESFRMEIALQEDLTRHHQLIPAFFTSERKRILANFFQGLSRILLRGFVVVERSASPPRRTLRPLSAQFVRKPQTSKNETGAKVPMRPTSAPFQRSQLRRDRAAAGTSDSEAKPSEISKPPRVGPRVITAWMNSFYVPVWEVWEGTDHEKGIVHHFRQEVAELFSSRKLFQEEVQGRAAIQVECTQRYLFILQEAEELSRRTKQTIFISEWCLMRHGLLHQWMIRVNRNWWRTLDMLALYVSAEDDHRIRLRKDEALRRRAVEVNFRSNVLQ